MEELPMKKILLLLFLTCFLRSAEGGIVINEILADPPSGISGDANRDGVRSASDDEFVEFLNIGPSSVSLSGWTFSDGGGIRHIFSSSSSIPSYGFFVLFGGGDPLGFDTFSVSSAGLLSLNNSGDSIFLRDVNGTLIDSLLYGSEANHDVSLTRFPDGAGPFVKHTSVSNLPFSPGTTIEGENRLSDPSAVPEPSTFLLLGMGLWTLISRTHRRLPFLTMLLLTAVLVVGGPAKNVSADQVWEEVTNGIPEHDFRTIAVDPQDARTVYIGTSKSLYRTLDEGKNWKNVFSGHGTLKAIHQILMTSRGDVWIATDNGLFRSSGDGEAWEKVFSGIGEKGRRILSIVMPKGEERIFLGTGEGLFTSLDGGKHWERGKGEILNEEVFFLATTPSQGVLYAAAPKGVYRSKDSGETWERVFVTSVEVGESPENGNGMEEGDFDERFTSAERVTSIVVREGPSQTVFLGTQKGVYHSIDEGKSWFKVSSIGLGNAEVGHLCLYGGSLYAATREGIFVFKEEEKKWDEVSRGLTEGEMVYLSASNRSFGLWAVSTEGIFRMTEERVEVEGWRREIAEVLHRFDHEPPIQEIQEAAIRYAEVHPEKIIAWRKAAARKAYLPTVSTGLGMDIDRNIAIDTGGTTNPDFFITGPHERGFDWDMNVSWNLGELVWNDDQTSIDVRSRLMVQLRDDVLDEVTRLYFERRRLQITLFLGPPKELKDKIEKELRLQELTAGIDALTGGHLSRVLQSQPRFSRRSE